MPIEFPALNHWDNHLTTIFPEAFTSVNYLILVCSLVRYIVIPIQGLLNAALNWESCIFSLCSSMASAIILFKDSCFQCFVLVFYTSGWFGKFESVVLGSEGLLWRPSV